jgi:hypothetical protein
MGSTRGSVWWLRKLDRDGENLSLEIIEFASEEWRSVGMNDILSII